MGRGKLCVIVIQLETDLYDGLREKSSGHCKCRTLAATGPQPQDGNAHMSMYACPEQWTPTSYIYNTAI